MSHHTFKLGAYTCHALEAGIQKLDGGAMFGVVPKPLWERRIAPDARNRIPLAMRTLLIEHPAGPVLIDSGMGNKEDPKFLDIYGVENSAPGFPTRLEAALDEVGAKPADVKHLINTHLHFDHAGGNTLKDADGTIRPSFPNATYYVQGGDIEFARHANERTRASYLPHNYEPIADAGLWKFLSGDGQVLPGISVRITAGHVPFHQGIVLQSQGETLFYLADLMPTRHHLPLPWIMGYDVEPLRSLESKRALTLDALAGGWKLFFEHDPDTVMGRLHEGAKGVELVETVATPANAFPPT